MKKRCMFIIVLFLICAILITFNHKTKYLVDEQSIATFIDGSKSDSFPEKGTVAFEKADCDDNANIYWDKDTWGLYVTNLNEKTKCNLYFKTLENAVTKITNLASTDTVSIATDDPDNNIRYIGANPNNYVYFNCDDYNNQTNDTCEKWRIIGVFNNVEKEDGIKENLIKIIKDETIGNIAWNTNIVNDWNNSSLQNYLNEGKYYSSSLKTSQTQDAIEKVIWNIGGSSNSEDATAEIFYKSERGTEVYSERSTTWLGKIALMYPSDYGYATSGGTTKDRAACLAKELLNWDASDFSDCKGNDYLYNYNGKVNGYWTLMPRNYGDSTSYVIAIYYYDGTTRIFPPRISNGISPTLFLKSNISIKSGTGESSSPYQLSVK